MERYRFKDLELEGYVAIYPEACYCAIAQEGFGDVEVSFEPEDCRAFVELLEQIIRSSQAKVPPDDSERFQARRFLNRDGNETAAFLVRRHLGGIEIAFASGLGDEDDPSEVGHGGVSACISVENAGVLVDAFKDRLRALSESPPATDHAADRS